MRISSMVCLVTMISTLNVKAQSDLSSGDDQEHQCADNTRGQDFSSCAESWTLCESQPCLNGKEQVMRRQLCDGYFDCSDLSDECLCDRRMDENAVTFDICNNIVMESQSDNEQNCSKGYMQCDKKKDSATKTCFDKTQICNNVTDCEDQLDEKLCRFLSGSPIGVRHVTRSVYVCDSDGKLVKKDISESGCVDGKWSFIDWRRKFDGVADCEDISDEWNPNFVYCDDESGTELSITRCSKEKSGMRPLASQYDAVETMFFPYIEWFLGIFGLIGNTIVAIHSIVGITRKERRHPNSELDTNGSTTTLRIAARSGKIINHILVLFLCISDLLMSIQIIFMASANEYFRGKYWQHDVKWLSSSTCAVIGSMAIFSTQASAFMIVVISFVRLYVVSRPFKTLRVKCVLVACILTYLIAAILMAIPLMTFSITFDNYFTSAVYVPNNIQADATVLERDETEQYVRRIVKLNGRTIERDFSNLKWTELEEIVMEINPDFGNWRYFGFYSQISVCIPPIVAHWTDPGLIYSFLLLIIDFAAFLLVFVAYYIVFRTTRRGRNIPCIMAVGCCTSNRPSRSEAAEANVNDEVPTVRQRSRSMTRDEEDYEMQKRILWIIGTDFLCWSPICLLTLASIINENIKGTNTLLLAMVLVQINCVVNPLVYSRRIRSGIKRFSRKLIKKLRKALLYACKRRPKQERRVDNFVPDSPNELPLYPVTPSTSDANLDKNA